MCIHVPFFFFFLPAANRSNCGKTLANNIVNTSQVHSGEAKANSKNE